MKTINDYQGILDKVKKLDADSVSEIDIINIICDFGLKFDNRRIYAKYEPYMNKDEEVGLWQRPDELAPLIKHLLRECNIDSFLEVGTFKASTFLIIREFLRLKNKNLKSLTIDPNRFVLDDFINHFNINYRMTDINSINEQYDLIFIDGDHSYNSVKADYQKALSLNPKYILFHDINDKYCHGVVALWNEIKNIGMNNIEFKTNDEVMGLGLVILK